MGRTSNWSHEDDFRTNDGTTTPATRENGTLFQWMVQFFKHWQDHPEVRAAYYGPNLEYNAYEDRGGYGWWAYPPQVMLGMYPADYERLGLDGQEAGPVGTAGKYNTFVASADDTGWTQEQWRSSMPCRRIRKNLRAMSSPMKKPLLWLTCSMPTRILPSALSAAMSSSSGILHRFQRCRRAREMDTIPYAVQAGMTDRSPGNNYPDIGILWNDFTATVEPMNRVERSKSSAAYLDGPGENPSAW